MFSLFVKIIENLIKIKQYNRVYPYSYSAERHVWFYLLIYWDKLYSLLRYKHHKFKNLQVSLKLPDKTDSNKISAAIGGSLVVLFVVLLVVVVVVVTVLKRR